MDSAWAVEADTPQAGPRQARQSCGLTAWVTGQQRPAGFAPRGTLYASGSAKAFPSLSDPKPSTAGFAGKGGIQSQGCMGMSRRQPAGGKIGPSGRLVGATAPVL